jgi:cyclic nucleotide-binding protein
VERSTGEACIAELHGEAQLSRGAAMPADQPQIIIRECVVTGQGAVIERGGEFGELGTLRGREQLAGWHGRDRVSQAVAAENCRFAATTVCLAWLDERRCQFMLGLGAGLGLVETGRAEVTLVDRRGASHHVNLVGPGDVLGEMSIFTGRPASATVRALEDLSVIVLTKDEFHELGDAFPRLYQNLGGFNGPGDTEY